MAGSFGWVCDKAILVFQLLEDRALGLFLPERELLRFRCDLLLERLRLRFAPEFLVVALTDLGALTLGFGDFVRWVVLGTFPFGWLVSSLGYTKASICVI